MSCILSGKNFSLCNCNKLHPLCHNDNTWPSVKKSLHSLIIVYRIYVNFGFVFAHNHRYFFLLILFHELLPVLYIILPGTPFSSAENILIKQTKYTYCTCKWCINTSVRIHVCIVKKVRNICICSLPDWLFFTVLISSELKESQKNGRHIGLKFIYIYM